MIDKGVFAVSRAVWDHPILDDGEPFSKREAWIWLLSAAAWKKQKIMVTGHVIELQRGEFCFSIRFLAKKWGWSKDRVLRVFCVLKNQDMIRDTSRDSAQVYLISNYNAYQVVGLPDRDSIRDDERDDVATGPRQDRDKEETFKQNKKKKEKSISAESASPVAVAPSLFFTEDPPLEKTKPHGLNGHRVGFIAFYDAFAKHVAKRQAEKAYVAALKRGATPQQILEGAKRYAREREGEDPKFTKQPATWLNADCWLDEAPSGTDDGLKASLERIEQLNRVR